MKLVLVEQRIARIRMSDWKNNPAIAAIIAGSVVLTTTLLVTFNYVLPVYQQADKNAITELKSGLETQKKNTENYEDQKKKLTEENSLLKSEVAGYKDYLLNLSLASVFQRGVPLPVGFAKIYPGMKLDSVYDTYEKVKILPGKSGGYLEVRPNISALGSIIYYAGDDENPNLITHIFVHKYEVYFPSNKEEEQLESSIEKLSLLDFLTENLGVAEVCGTTGHFWHLPKEQYYIYYSSDDSDEYSIWLKGKSKPGIGKDCERKVWNL